MTFAKNPNSISTGLYTFKIPIKPVAATKVTATPLGAIGISLNGVPFYNQYAGPNQPLAGEMTSFDQYYGHPAPGGKYHYHVEPLYLTQVKADKMALLGFLLDGFPVYGPWESGKELSIPVSAALYTYHGCMLAIDQVACLATWYTGRTERVGTHRAHARHQPSTR